jgi:hypothetical protein
MTFDFNGAAGDPLAVVFVNSLDFRIRVDFDPGCSRGSGAHFSESLSG